MKKKIRDIVIIISVLLGIFVIIVFNRKKISKYFRNKIEQKQSQKILEDMFKQNSSKLIDDIDYGHA